MIIIITILSEHQQETDPGDKRREEDQNRWIVKEDRVDVKSRTSLPDMSSIDISKESIGL